MKLLNGFSIGIKGFFKAIPFIFKHKLWWTFFVPIILNIFLYTAGFSVTNFFGDWISAKFDTWINIDNGSKTLQYVPNFLKGLTYFLFQIAFFFAFSFFGGYIILILLSPLFAWLSEKTDNIINNSDYPFSFSQFMSDIWRGIIIAIRNMLYELGVSLLILIATFVPFFGQVLSPITFILYFLLTSYFYGFSYMDYTNERNKLSIKQSIIFVRKYRGIAIANGSLFYLTLLIPFVGVLLSGFTSIIATVGATIAIYERDNN